MQTMQWLINYFAQQNINFKFGIFRWLFLFS